MFDFSVLEYETPANDDCSGAIEISIPSSGASFVNKGLTTLGALPDFDSPYTDLCKLATFDTRGLWYRLVGRGTVVRLEYQLYVKDLGKSEMLIFVGSCGTSLSCYERVQGESDWYNTNDLVVTEFIAEDGIDYYIWLSGKTFETAGSFDLNVVQL